MRLSLRKTSITCLAMILTVSTLFSGCQSTNNSSSKTASSKEADDNPNELVYICNSLGGNHKYIATSSTHIEALNALLKKRGCNLSIKFEPYPENGYLEKLCELKKSGSKADLIFSGYMQTCDDSPYVKFTKEGLYADMSKYLDSDKGKKLKDALCSKSIENSKINGKTYAIGVPDYMGTYLGYLCDADMMKKYNLSEDDFKKDLWDLEPTIKKVSEGEKSNANFKVMHSINRDLSNLNYCDLLSESVGVVMRGKDATAKNLYCDEYVKKYLSTIKKYQDAGYITDDPKEDFLFVENLGVSNDIGTRESKDNSGKVIKKIFVPHLPECAGYQTLQGRMNGIASWSNNKDKAFEFIYLMNTDKEIANLMEFGIEGTDYSVSDGTVKFQSSKNQSLYGGTFFVNNFLLYNVPNKGKNADIKKEDNAMQSSPILGFFFDKTPVEKEIKATDAVSEKWNQTLFKGEEANFDEAYASLNKELKDAGIDKIIAEANKQISAFKAKK